jgi:hypothetical protein
VVTFTPGERAHGIHWKGGWECPRAGLDAAEKRKCLTLPGLDLQSLGDPALSQLLYRLSYLDRYLNFEGTALKPEDGGSRVIRNVGNSLPKQHGV